MGAILADAALQRRARYKSVVEPRVRALFAEWPDTVTVSVFSSRIAVASSTGRPLAAVIQWRGLVKLQVIDDLVAAATCLGIETADDLKNHLTDPDLRDVAEGRLNQIFGVGRKTIDYLARLAGARDRVAVDLHLRNFASAAGVTDLTDRHLQSVYCQAALQRGWPEGALDRAVWEYGEAVLHRTVSPQGHAPPDQSDVVQLSSDLARLIVDRWADLAEEEHAEVLDILTAALPLTRIR